MKVSNMTSNNGNTVANQFLLTDNNMLYRAFQSYDSLIVTVETKEHPTIKGDDYKRVLDSLWRFEQNYLEFTRLYLGEDYINDSLHLTEL